jgi:hypothetical protein
MLHRRYGVAASDVDELAATQGGRCAICGAKDPRHLDHDHITGANRGVLCFSCNGALGQFADNLELLALAAAYLAQPRLLCASEGLAARSRDRLCFACQKLKPRAEFVVGRPAGVDGAPFCRPCYDRREIDSRIGALVRRHYRLRRRYHIGHEQYAQLVKLQRGRCAVCLSGEAVDVDHDHERGIVRGLLCGRCNTGVGQLQDDPRIIRRAIDYLKRHRPDDVQEPATPYILSVA